VVVVAKKTPDPVSVATSLAEGLDTYGIPGFSRRGGTACRLAATVLFRYDGVLARYSKWIEP
jgi:hypothetical protein